MRYFHNSSFVNLCFSFKHSEKLFDFYSPRNELFPQRHLLNSLRTYIFQGKSSTTICSSASLWVVDLGTQAPHRCLRRRVRRDVTGPKAVRQSPYVLPALLSPRGRAVFTVGWRWWICVRTECWNWCWACQYYSLSGFVC